MMRSHFGSSPCPVVLHSDDGLLRCWETSGKVGRIQSRLAGWVPTAVAPFTLKAGITQHAFASLA